jgi:hypothetical protein
VYQKPFGSVTGDAKSINKQRLWES